MLEITWQSFNLQDPYHYRGTSRQTKESAFLTLFFQNMKFSSELSVFPGLHETNRSFYENQLPKDLFKNLKLPHVALENSNQVGRWAHQYYSTELAPNILQALDTLLLEILGTHKKLPSAWQKIFEQPQWCCDSAQLITQLHHALELKNQEGVFKIKMGRDGIDQDIQNLKMWMTQNPNATVRLDANHLWTAQDLDTLLSRLTESELEAIEYLEDPCSLEQWQRLSASKKPALALEQLSSPVPFEVCVYRPSSEKGLLLGIGEFEKLSQESANQEVVLSSSFETPLGLQWCIFMANVLGLKRAQGLGTLSHLNLDPVQVPRLPVSTNGMKICISRA